MKNRKLETGNEKLANGPVSGYRFRVSGFPFSSVPASQRLF